MDEPETGLAHKGTQVDAEGGEEILMLKVHNFVHEVLHEDADHPDLLISDTATGAFVKAVLTKAVRKGVLHLREPRLVQVLNLLLLQGGGIKGFKVNEN